MKRLLLAFALLLSLLADGQQYTPVFHKDSLPARLKKYWRFHEGDSAVWAVPAFNDSAWPETNSELRMKVHPEKATDSFSSIAWLRYHFKIDSDLVNIPLALAVTQYGASEIYLDGKKVQGYGTISGQGGSHYYDPQYQPFTIVMQAPGDHVLAVRYANYEAMHMLKVYSKDFAGFKIVISKANNAVANYAQREFWFSSLFMFMFGLFMALTIVHLFLFLYYRAAISNLYFSIFSLCLSFLFFIPYTNMFSSSPVTQLRNVYFTLGIAALSCISYSGLSNELFGKSKLRFRIIMLVCIAAPFIYFVDQNASTYSILIMVGVVSLESIVLVIRAIVLKVKGMGIIGFGIFLLGAFFLSVVILGLTMENIEFRDDNAASQVLEFVGVIAILGLPISISVHLARNFASINKDLKAQLIQVQVLSEKALQQEQEKKLMLENRKQELEAEVAVRTEEVMAQKQEIEKQHDQLKAEKKKTDDLLLNILPEEIAEELKQKGKTEAKFFDQVTVLFTDFVGFTTAGERMSPQALVDELDACFEQFDNICSKYNIEKIKTIGDAYLAVCGLPVADTNHAVNVTNAALEILEYMMSRRERMGDKAFEIRVGIHSGSVVAGIVGVKKFAYDIWGDTVNTAARMEQNSEAGKINVSEATYELIKDNFNCTYRGKISAKNKGELNMYFVEPLRP